MTARWEDALDAQLDVITSHNEPAMRRHVDGWAEAESRKGRIVDAEIARISDKVRWAAMRADPVWVEPEMMTLWEAAIEGFEPEKLMPDDLIATSGFIYLPRPHYVTDVHGRKVSVRAYMWDAATLTSRDRNHVTGEMEERNRGERHWNARPHGGSGGGHSGR